MKCGVGVGLEKRVFRVCLNLPCWCRSLKNNFLSFPLSPLLRLGK